MSKKLVTMLALALSLMLLAAACGGGDDEAADVATDEPVITDTAEPTGAETTPEETGTATVGEGGDFSIAYQGPLTGDNAALGVNMLRGVQLAVQELADEGINLTVEQLDSQGDPAQAPPLAQAACSDEAIVAVVGPSFSGETAASGPIYEECGLPFISPSATNPDLSENGWTYFFRTVATDATQGPVAATFITDNLGATQVAVVDDASEYGKGLADIVESSLEELGATVVAREGIEAGGTDFSPVVGTIVGSGAEALFYGGYFSDAGLLARQLAEQGGEDITFVSDDGTFDNGFIEIAGESAAEGAFVSFPGADPLSADPEFLEAFRAEFDADPGAFTIEAYQNTLLIGEALKSGATDRDAIRDFVADFSGEIFGKNIEFQENGDIAAQTFFIYEVQDGAFVQVEAVEPATS